MQHVNPVTEFDVDDSQPVFASPVTDPSAAVPDNQVDSVVTSHHVDPLRISKQPLPCLPTNSPRGYDHRHVLQHVPDFDETNVRSSSTFQTLMPPLPSRTHHYLILRSSTTFQTSSLPLPGFFNTFYTLTRRSAEFFYDCRHPTTPFD